MRQQGDGPAPAQAMLRAVRARSGVSQRKIAEAVGISKSSLSRREAGPIPYVDDVLRAVGLEVGTWDTLDRQLVDRISSWWQHHPLDRATRCLREHPELVAGPPDMTARAIHDVVAHLPFVPNGACAELFLLPPELVRPVTVWSFVTPHQSEGAIFVHRRLGLVQVGDGAARGFPRTLVTNALPMTGPRQAVLALRLPQPRDLIVSSGVTPALAAAVRAADVLGPGAVAGAGLRVLQVPWRQRPLWDEEYDVEEWDPDDPGAGSEPDPSRNLWSVPREKREWFGI